MQGEMDRDRLQDWMISSTGVDRSPKKFSFIQGAREAWFEFWILDLEF
jgi:hypothetical protein